METTEDLIAGRLPATPGLPDWDFDCCDEAVLRDPFPYDARLRDMGPVVRMTRYGALAVGRYEEKQVFSDHARFVSSRGVGLDDFAVSKPWRPPSIILAADPPEHARARKATSRALSPRVVKTLTGDFRAAAERIVAGVQA